MYDISQAFKYNSYGDFYEIGIVLTIEHVGYTSDIVRIITVKKDGSDLESCIQEELDFYKKRYSSIKFIKIV